MHLLHGLVAHYGDFAVLGLVFLAAAYVPIPSSLVIVVAGSLVAVGRLQLASTFAAALAGSVIGDTTGYALARRITPVPRWRRRAERHRDLARLERLLKRRPLITIVWSRFAPFGGSSVNSLAGMSHMRLARFLPPDVVGNLLYVSAYLALGHLFGWAWGNAATTATVAGAIAFLVAGAGVFGFLLTRRRKER